MMRVLSIFLFCFAILLTWTLALQFGTITAHWTSEALDPNLPRTHSEQETRDLSQAGIHLEALPSPASTTPPLQSIQKARFQTKSHFHRQQLIEVAKSVIQEGIRLRQMEGIASAVQFYEICAQDPSQAYSIRVYCQQKLDKTKSQL